MELLYITYKVDSESSIVGHVVGWIKGLSDKFTRVEVICLSYSGEALPGNVTVHSLSKDVGCNRIKRLFRFIILVWNLRNSIQVVFCQFSPEYVIGVAPFALLFSWPVVLWYTHKHVSLKLRLATLFATRVVTASAESFQIHTNKRQIIGHGINTDRFKPGLVNSDNVPVILSVGRLSSIKNYELLIDCIAYLQKKHINQHFEVRIIGGEERNSSSGYYSVLQEKIAKLDLVNIVKLMGPVSYVNMVDIYSIASVHINLCPTGGLDKAVLEGMACGVPTLVLNRSFAALQQIPSGFEIISSDDVELISDKLFEYINISEYRRQMISNRIREVIVKSYDQNKFLETLSTTIQQLVN